MSGQKTFVALAVVALGVISGATALASDHRGRGRGYVLPCSLDGVNPVYHPDIFGNAAVAASYGFVRSADGTWHVRPGCRR